MTDDELRAAYMAGAPGALAWPWPEGLRAVLATSLTQAIQRLNNIPYNVTQYECIEVLQDLRAELATPLAAARVPLTPDQVKAITAETGYDRASPAVRAVFLDGIRHGERAHGIEAASQKGDAA